MKIFPAIEKNVNKSLFTYGNVQPFSLGTLDVPKLLFTDLKDQTGKADIRSVHPSPCTEGRHRKVACRRTECMPETKI